MHSATVLPRPRANLSAITVGQLNTGKMSGPAPSGTTKYGEGARGRIWNIQNRMGNSRLLMGQGQGRAQVQMVKLKMQQPQVLPVEGTAPVLSLKIPQAAQLLLHMSQEAPSELQPQRALLQRHRVLTAKEGLSERMALPTCSADQTGDALGSSARSYLRQVDAGAKRGLLRLPTVHCCCIRTSLVELGSKQKNSAWTL